MAPTHRFLVAFALVSAAAHAQYYASTSYINSACSGTVGSAEFFATDTCTNATTSTDTQPSYAFTTCNATTGVHSTEWRQPSCAADSAGSTTLSLACDTGTYVSNQYSCATALQCTSGVATVKTWLQGSLNDCAGNADKVEYLRTNQCFQVGAASSQRASCSAGDGLVVRSYGNAGCSGPGTVVRAYPTLATCGQRLDAPDDELFERQYASCDCNTDATATGGPGAGCFSGAATVVTESGAEVALMDVRVGDRVQAAAADGTLAFARVFRITHWEPEAAAPFLRLTTADGHALEVTPDHKLHVGSCCSLSAAAPASSVAVGDVVFTTDATTGSVQPSTVVSVQEVAAVGVVNVHTVSGQLVASGVAATHFTAATTWGASSRGWAPVWYAVADAAGSVLGRQDASAGRR